MSWLSGLLAPWTSGPIEIPETRPPRELARPGSKFAKVDGIDVHYTEIGAPSADYPTLVLWHGFNGSVFNWRYVMKRLEQAGSCHAIAFDRPPFGLTERPPPSKDGLNPYSTDGAISLARGLLKQRDVTRAVHVGHSAGANAALKLALAHQGELEGLILVSPAIGTENTRKNDLKARLRSKYMQYVLNHESAGLRLMQKQILDRSESVRDGGDVGRFDHSRVTAEDVELYLLPVQADNWDMGALENFKTFKWMDPPEFDKLKLPVLVLQGKDDGATTLPFVRKLVAVLEKRPEGSTKTIEIDECGHLPMEEYPEKVSKAMLKYVQSRSGKGEPELETAAV